MAPLIYFYCLLMIGEVKRFEKKFLIYFSSSIIPLVCWIYYAIYYTPREKFLMLDLALETEDILFVITNRAIELQFVFFMILCVYKVSRFKKNLLKVVSDTERLKVEWVSKFIRLMLGLSVILGVSAMFTSGLLYALVILPILSNIFYFYIIYESFSNSVLFTKNEFDHFHNELKIISEAPDEKKPGTINKQDLERDAIKIEAIIKDHKPYLNPNLTLGMLADMTELSLHRLSEVINNQYQQNFFEFINCFRVEYAKKMLLDPKSQVFTFESLAEECGFGSKVTFNRAFKKITGKTPSEYKKDELERLAKSY